MNGVVIKEGARLPNRLVIVEGKGNKAMVECVAAESNADLIKNACTTISANLDSSLMDDLILKVKDLSGVNKSHHMVNDLKTLEIMKTSEINEAGKVSWTDPVNDEILMTDLDDNIRQDGIGNGGAGKTGGGLWFVQSQCGGGWGHAALPGSRVRNRGGANDRRRRSSMCRPRIVCAGKTGGGLWFVQSQCGGGWGHAALPGSRVRNRGGANDQRRRSSMCRPRIVSRFSLNQVNTYSRSSDPPHFWINGLDQILRYDLTEDRSDGGNLILRFWMNGPNADGPEAKRQIEYTFFEFIDCPRLSVLLNSKLEMLQIELVKAWIGLNLSSPECDCQQALADGIWSGMTVETPGMTKRKKFLVWEGLSGERELGVE
ncbi:hypothetical protein MA16_Dca011364 [Dendrobium catenatum]|uniref:Uncharacterized protein n=1 Tax=Dendrobium catenatum TaxID=906689 RepID=A0A2I0WNX1_9ASPA|nr:hypothetical protein MA16_Dca011364 [Dendrobium catenatum]